RDLFPIELRREYRRFRRVVRTMQIVSDEPWIPWELVKPYDGEDPSDPVDDDFFCVQYLFARWFTPAAPPAQQIVIRNLAAITPADCDLASAHTEQAMVRGLAARYALNDRTPAAATRRAVEALLGGAEPVELWHFAGHGSFRSDAPNRSALQLENNAALRPDDLVGPVETRLRSDRPLFVLNACRVGSVGLSLTGLGGWAKVLVQDCGVGALIAPLWEVNDQLAQVFCTTFYEALAVPGATVAEAARQARNALKTQAPQDPIWLAYSLFAHPNAQITLGAGPLA
ncbi:MAG: CHAT domain-containing protein, partial [Gammaproteobacteria bacterium]|nr:CHAT domain-containing protein [Gammaproteobacteria bacterium]